MMNRFLLAGAAVVVVLTGVALGLSLTPANAAESPTG
jgi:hypothetical protein